MLLTGMAADKAPGRRSRIGRGSRDLSEKCSAKSFNMIADVVKIVKVYLLFIDNSLNPLNLIWVMPS